jgi:hypothetical protein
MRCAVMSCTLRVPSAFLVTGWTIRRICGDCPYCLMMASERPGAPGSKRMPAICHASIDLTSAGRPIRSDVPATTACGAAAMPRNCWNAVSLQTRSRLVGSRGFGTVRSAIEIRLARSCGFVGVGKSQDTSLAERGASGGVATAAVAGDVGAVGVTAGGVAAGWVCAAAAGAAAAGASGACAAGTCAAGAGVVGAGVVGACSAGICADALPPKATMPRMMTTRRGKIETASKNLLTQFISVPTNNTRRDSNSIRGQNISTW